MPQIEFFAARDDLIELLRFFYAETDARILEHSSRPDSDLREFRSIEEVDQVFSLGCAPPRSGFNVHLALWSPTVMPKLDVRRIDFDPTRVRDAKYRLEPTGAGLIQLYLGGVADRVITKSHFGHLSQAKARTWGVDEGVQWERLSRLSRKVKYHIGRRLAAARVPGRAVLSAAAALWEQGHALKESANAPFHWEQSGLWPDA
jgi:hypothetical protein